MARATTLASDRTEKSSRGAYDISGATAAAASANSAHPSSVNNKSEIGKADRDIFEIMLFPDGPIDFGYARQRLHDMLRPQIISGPPKGVRFEKDVPVKMRDGFDPAGQCLRPKQRDAIP